MAIDDQITPSEQEYKTTGAIGILIYLALFASALYSIKKGFKSKTSKRFFSVVALLCALELPRYFGLAVQASYASTALYSLHILANSVFFISFSIVCYQWSGLLKLGTYFKIFYGVKGLIAANLTFTIVDIVAVAVCVLSRNLDAYFSSFFFEIFTFIEAVRNVVYVTFLTFYGLKLVFRFWHFSSISTSVASSGGNRWIPANIQMSGGAGENQMFKQAVCRLTTVLTVTSICFLLRMCMLAAKMAALYSSRVITTETFTLFGFWWFVFADFLPRVVPTVAFMQLMGTHKKLTPEQRRSLQTGDDYTYAQYKNADTSDEFQFVLLAGDDVEVKTNSKYSVNNGNNGNGNPLIEGWKNLDADSLFGGDDEENDDEDDDDRDVVSGPGAGRGSNVDDLYTIQLNLNGLSPSSKKKKAVVVDTINL
jgi:hypothetical protein